jgi:16S rRNA processing protein RimM
MNANDVKMVMIGEILRSHGVRGVVKIRATTDDPARFFLLKKVLLERNTASLGEFAIERVQPRPKDVLVKFYGIDDYDQAEKLRGAAVMIPRQECLPKGEGEFYQFEIVGLPVYTTAGTHLGEVAEIYALPANDVWVIRKEGQEALIPAIKPVVQTVDLINQRIVVAPIPGLLDDQKTA